MKDHNIANCSHVATSWDDLLQIRNEELPKKQLLYRGQSNACWELTSSLERCATRYSVPFPDLPKCEWNLIREFKRKAHQYVANPPAPDRVLEWLALMQHHGAPTRLTDWSYSFYVGMWMACSGEGATLDDCALWVIDQAWFTDTARSIIRRKRKFSFSKNEKDVFQPDEGPRFDKRFRAVFLEKPLAVAYPINPFRLNVRLSVQHGAFVAPGNIALSFHDNLRAMSETKILRDHLWLITIRKQAIPGCLRQLHDMGISAASVYPGLEGYSRSLQARSSFIEDIGPQSKDWSW